MKKNTFSLKKRILNFPREEHKLKKCINKANPFRTKNNLVNCF